MAALMMSDTALIVIRGLVYADLLPLFGLALFALYGLGAPEEAFRLLRIQRRTAWLALGGLALSFLHIAAMAAAMSGADSVSGIIDASGMMLTMHGMGTALIVRLVALVLVLLACGALTSKPRAALVAIASLSGIAVATMAWAGHGATGSVGGWWHLASDLAHVLAAGGWIGALVALLTLLFSNDNLNEQLRRKQLVYALGHFASMGSLLVGTIVVTGVVNAGSLMVWRGATELLRTGYGKLLVLKVGLFFLMLLLATLNRFCLSPALSQASSGREEREMLRALRLSITLETILALSIVAVVAVLGTLSPPR